MDQSPEVGRGSERPKRSWRLWWIYALLLWGFIRILIVAFSRPWSWLPEQFLVVIFALCAIFVCANLTLLWWQGGVPALKKRMAVFQQFDAAMVRRQSRLPNFLLWTVVAAIAGFSLAIFFNLLLLVTQH
jgi:hypothetical protein